MYALLKRAQEEQRKILYLDEAVFSFNTFRTKAWSQAYQSIQVYEAKMKMKAQAIVAAISEDIGYEHSLIHLKSITSVEFVKFLEELSEKYSGQPLYIFMDNLQVHKSVAAREAYTKLNITPIYNIPYSPQFNGIESYFGLVKLEYKNLLLKCLMND